MKRILLTGATGFLGSYLLEALLGEGYQVVILKRSTSDTWRIKSMLNQVTSYDVDTQSLELAFTEQRIDALIHTACSYGRKGESFSQMVDTNLMYGLRLLDACLKFNTDTFFNTDTLLQEHLNNYTLSKKQFIEWLKKLSNKLQIVNLKLEHMYGPNDDSTKFASWVTGQFNKKVPEIELTTGEQERDFIYITDVVSAYMTTLKQSEKLPVFSEYDVGTGRLISVKGFIEELKRSYENQFGIISTQLNFGAIPLRKNEMMTVDVDNSSLIALGWQPEVSLEQGLHKLLSEVGLDKGRL